MTDEKEKNKETLICFDCGFIFLADTGKHALTNGSRVQIENRDDRDKEICLECAKIRTERNLWEG